MFKKNTSAAANDGSVEKGRVESQVRAVFYDKATPPNR